MPIGVHSQIPKTNVTNFIAYFRHFASTKGISRHVISTPPFAERTGTLFIRRDQRHPLDELRNRRRSTLGR
jgi:hypothetical protein